MREGMFDRAPLSGLAGGVPVLDFRKAPGSRGGKAGEAARFIAALRAMASQHNRDVFSTAELQVSAVAMSPPASQGMALPIVARGWLAEGSTLFCKVHLWDWRFPAAEWTGSYVAGRPWRCTVIGWINSSPCML